VVVAAEHRYWEIAAAPDRDALGRILAGRT